jgi:hypothetical protein
MRASAVSALRGSSRSESTRPIEPAGPMHGARRGAHEARPLPLSASARTAGGSPRRALSRTRRGCQPGLCRHIREGFQRGRSSRARGQAAAPDYPAVAVRKPKARWVRPEVSGRGSLSKCQCRWEAAASVVQGISRRYRDMSAIGVTKISIALNRYAVADQHRLAIFASGPKCL